MPPLPLQPGWPPLLATAVCSALLASAFSGANAAPAAPQCAASQWKTQTCAPCTGKHCTVVARLAAADAASCCAKCTDNRLCNAWTFNYKQASSESCHLKTAGTATQPGNCTSGFLDGPAPGPPPPTPGPANHSRPNVLFLMCDSMDGRVLDPTSVVHTRLKMPNLRALASRGVNFVNTYAASPQCVPSRTTMFAGRHIDRTRTWNNGQGVAVVPSSGGLDAQCLSLYDEKTCSGWRSEQNVTATLLDSMRQLQYEMHLYGKVDVGAGILQDRDEVNATCNGYHSGPTLSILTRTADIRRPTKPDPLKITNDLDNNVHAEDWKMLPKCIEYLRDRAAAAQGLGGATATNWVLYCSINIPHPAFDTNATWLSYVNDENVDVPKWLPEGRFHPADSYMSISKAAWRNFTDQEILKVRKTYYAMCAETDYMLGRVLDALDATGQRYAYVCLS